MSMMDALRSLRSLRPLRARVAARFCAVVLLLPAASVVHAQSCIVTNAPALNFSVNPLATGPTDAVSSVTVRCEALLSLLSDTAHVCLHLEAGSGGVGAGSRLMTSGTGTLAFNVFKDAGHTQIWGSSSVFAPGQWLASVHMPALLGLYRTGSVTIPVHGRVPAQSGLISGVYASSVPGTLHATMNPSTACNGAAHPFTLSAQATVVKTCSVSAEPLDFGSRGLLDQPVDATSSLQVRCNAGTAYSVRLGSGSAPGATFANRRMQRVDAPAAAIGYQLYRDAGRTLVWGDGSAGTVTAGGVGTGGESTHPVYARLPAQPSQPPGSYRDTVVVTVTY